MPWCCEAPGWRWVWLLLGPAGCSSSTGVKHPMISKEEGRSCTTGAKWADWAYRACNRSCCSWCRIVLCGCLSSWYMLWDELCPSRLTSSNESSGVTTDILFGGTGLREPGPANGTVGSGQSGVSCSTWCCCWCLLWWCFCWWCLF